MTRTPLSWVSRDTLQPVDALGNQLSPLNVGSDDWFAWLHDGKNQSFAYSGECGTFTARCERQRNGHYWYAYKRRGTKVHKIYLGLSERLTAGQLAAAAEELAEKRDMDIFASATSSLLGLADVRQTIDGVESSLERRRRLTRHDSQRLITLARVVVQDLEGLRLGGADGEAPHRTGR